MIAETETLIGSEKSESQEFIELVRSRNINIPDLLYNGQNFIPKLPWKTALIRLFNEVMVRHISVNGIGNLETALDLTSPEGQYSNLPLKIIHNHRVDADSLGHIATFDHLFYYLDSTDILDRLVYLAGLKMVEREETAAFMGGLNSVLVATPSDLQRVSKELETGLWGEEDRESLEEYKYNLIALNKSSGEKLGSLISQRFILSMFPESTRTRRDDMTMQRAPREVALYFRTGLVLPVVSSGMEEAFPRERRPEIDEVIHGANLRVVFGRPFWARDLWYQNRPGWNRGEESNVSDILIAKLGEAVDFDPKFVRAEEAPTYKNLLYQMPKTPLWLNS